MRSRRLALPPHCGSKKGQLDAPLKYKLALLCLLYLAQQDRTMVLDNRTRSVGLKEDLIL